MTLRRYPIGLALLAVAIGFFIAGALTPGHLGEIIGSGGTFFVSLGAAVVAFRGRYRIVAAAPEPVRRAS
jgi:hypothetical protein